LKYNIAKRGSTRLFVKMREIKEKMLAPVKYAGLPGLA